MIPLNPQAVQEKVVTVAALGMNVYSLHFPGIINEVFTVIISLLSIASLSLNIYRKFNEKANSKNTGTNA